jgi:hypothetical protein
MKVTREAAARWLKPSLFAWWTLFLLMVVGRAAGAFTTPWLVILSPLWGPPVLLVLYVSAVLAMVLLLLCAVMLVRLLKLVLP